VSVEERVIEIVSEQMGVSKDRSPGDLLHQRPRCRFARHRGTRDGIRRGIRHHHPDEEAEKIQTVGQAIDYIEQHAHAK